MKPQIQGENQFIYNEGDEIQCVFFLVSGRAGFVLPQYENVKYIDIKDGDKFGIIDIYGSTEKMNIKENEWYQKKSHLERHFTVMTFEDSEFLIINLNTVQ